MARVQLFLSTVSAEFQSYRERLRHLLTRPDVEVKVQEDFIVTGDETLEMLDTYIQGCDGVIHLVGDMTGAMAKPQSVAAIASRYPELGSRFPLAEFLQPDGPSLSYTQWEAWLALWHSKKLYIATPKDGAPRYWKYLFDQGQQTLQQAHLARLRSVARYSATAFSGHDDLASGVLRSFVLDLLVTAGLTRRPLTLPFASIGSLFKGRASLLEQLETATKPIALIGNGGVGKTRLAIEHARQQIGRCSAVLLITAGSAGALNRNLAALCKPEGLDLPQQNEKEESVQREAVLHWLQANSDWLLIVDSVDTMECAVAVEALLARFTGSQLLITTRLRNWSAAIRPIKVDELAPEDATAFLLERTADWRRQSEDDATTSAAIAVEDLGGLALALEQAGAYISQKRLTLADYRAQWQSNREQVLLWNDPQLMQYDRSLATTWLTSYQAVSDGARTLLRRLSWLSPEPIPEALLDVKLPVDPNGTNNSSEALIELDGYSLVTRSGETPFFIVHRLVQEVVRLWQKEHQAKKSLEVGSLASIVLAVRSMLRRKFRNRPNRDKQYEPNELLAALAWLHQAFQGNPWDVSTWATLRPLEAHGLAVTTHAVRVNIEPLVVGFILNEVALLHQARADYTTAESLLRLALEMKERIVGVNSPKLIIAINNLASLLNEVGKVADAESLYRRALAIGESHYQAEHPDVIAVLNNLANILNDDNRFLEARPLMEQVLSFYERVYGQDDPRVGVALGNLGLLLLNIGSYDEAEVLFRRSLAIAEKSYGKDHPSYALSLNNLGQVIQLVDPIEAEKLYRSAIVIYEANYGPIHPHLAVAFEHLADLIKNSKRFAEAEILYRRAFEVYEEIYGNKHPKVAMVLGSLADLLEKSNRLVEAETLYRRALEINEAIYGSDHRELVRDIRHLAYLLHKINRLVEAESLIRRALAIDEISYGNHSPEVAKDLHTLGKFLHDAKCQPEAELVLRRAIAIDEKRFGLEHPTVADDLNTLGRILEASGRLEEAEVLMRRALTINEKTYGLNHSDVAICLNNLAHLLQALDRPQEAKPLIERSLGIITAQYGQHDLSTATVLNNLGRLLKYLKQPEEAEPILAQAFATFNQILGFDHPRTKTALGNYCETLQAMGYSEDEIIHRILSAVVD